MLTGELFLGRNRQAHKQDTNSMPICRSFRFSARFCLYFIIVPMHHLPQSARFHPSRLLSLSARPLSILSRLGFTPNAEWKGGSKSIKLVPTYRGGLLSIFVLHTLSFRLKSLRHMRLFHLISIFYCFIALSLVSFLFVALNLYFVFIIYLWITDQAAP